MKLNSNIGKYILLLHFVLLQLYRNSVFLTIPYFVILHGWRYIFRIRYIPSYFYLIPNLSASHRELPPSLRHLVQFTNQKFKNFKKFQKFHKISKFSRILCNKTITTLELDQYGKKNFKKQWNVLLCCRRRTRAILLVFLGKRTPFLFSSSFSLARVQFSSNSES